MQRMIWRLAAAMATAAFAFVLGAVCAWTLANHSGAHAAVDGRMALAAQQSASPATCVPGVPAPVSGRSGFAATGSNREGTAQWSSSAERTSANESAQAALMSNGAGAVAHGPFEGRASGNRSTGNGGSETVTLGSGFLPDALGSFGVESVPAASAPLSGALADALATGISPAAVPTVAMPAFGLGIDASAQSNGSSMTGPAGATVAVNGPDASTPAVAIDASAQSDGSSMTGPAGASVAVDNGRTAATSVSLVPASEPDVTTPGQVGASTGTSSAPNAPTASSIELPSNGLTASVTAS
jgi:hypothetical protein